MNPDALTPPDARLALAQLQAEANASRSPALYLWLREANLADEVAASLFSLAEVSRIIDGRMIDLGKIIALQLVAFANAHPDNNANHSLHDAVACLTGSTPAVCAPMMPLALALGIPIDALIGRSPLPCNDSARAFFAPLSACLNALHTPQDALAA